MAPDMDTETETDMDTDTAADIDTATVAGPATTTDMALTPLWPYSCRSPFTEGVF